MKTRFLFYWAIVALFMQACAPSAPVATPASGESLLQSIPVEDNPTPTYVPAPGPYFSWGSGNTVPPNDVIREIGFYGGGGGVVVCHDFPGNDTSCRKDGIEPMQWIVISRDDVAPNEKVDVTITLPDNSIQKEVATSDAEGKLFYDYLPLAGFPLGEYRFSFDSAGMHFEETVEVVKPHVPRLYMTGDDIRELGEKKIILFNFLPNETVRLFAYTSEGGEFVIWQEFVVDENGMIAIENRLEENQYTFTAVGDESGVAYEPFEGVPIFSATTLWDTSIWGKGTEIYCEGAPDPVPGIGAYTNVIVISDNVFLEPMDAPYIENVAEHVYLPPGTEMEIWGVDSPFCKDHAYWWSVNCENVSEIANCNIDVGLIAEQLDGVQLIEPLGDCGGLPSRLSRGKDAVVVASNSAIRAHAGLDSDILASAPEGTKVWMHGFRRCVENSTWWKIYTDDWLVGWMAEDQDGVYLLEPFP